MNYLLILVTTCCTIVSQLVLKHGISRFAGLVDSDKITFLVRVGTSPWVAAALVLQVLGYVTWFFVITREKLGIAFALSGSFFYVAMALLSWALFDEKLTGAQWAGIGTVTLGVFLIARG